MPIMKPEHQRAMLSAQKLMADAGVEGVRAPAPAEATAKEILDRVGLSLEESLTELAILAKGNNEGLRSRALDTALKIHGVLKEAAAPVTPSFTIVINDNSQGTAPSTSPALSSSLPAGINPIFVPRQLLSQLSDDTTKTSN